MRDEDVLQILNEFSDHLEIGNILTYCLRWLGWMVIQGLAWFVDGLEGITDTMLGLKAFYHSEGIQDFVISIRPFLYIILAFSFLYIGYMMIMNRKMNREQMITNLFISIAVLVLLGTGMSKADKFTDDAVSFIKSENGGQSTISEKIIKDGFIDVAQFDVNQWKTTNLEQDQRNKIPQEKIKMIDITEKIGKDYKVSKDKFLSDIGKEVFSNKVILSSVGEESLVQLENGWFDFFPESYYRWYWDFWTIAISLFVIGMTLLLISIKLAKLCYELGFNYILATLLAPADIATGQRLKQVLINILNTFFVIMIIFISMKVYLLGTSFINDNFDGMAYLIALIAISLAVIDGPVMCERIFGIDAGLKSGWGMLVGGYALGKGIGGVAGKIGKGLGELGKKGASGVLAAGGGTAGLAVGLKGTGEKGIGDRKEILQDTMEADKDKKGNSQKAGENKGSLDKSSDTSAGSAVSLHDEMKAKENVTGANSASTGSTITVGKFHDEMKMAGYAQGTNSPRAEFNMQAASKTAISTGTSLSASPFHSNANQSGGTLQKEMQAAGFRQEAAKNAGHAAGDTLQQSMNGARQESATSAESASVGGGQQGASAIHQDFVASAAGSAPIDGLQQSVSEVHQESVTSVGSALSGGLQQSMSEVAHQEFGTNIGSMPSSGVQQGVSVAHQELVGNAGSAPSGGVQQSTSEAVHQESVTSAGSALSSGVQQSMSTAHQESVTSVGSVPSDGVQQGMSVAHQELVGNAGSASSGGVQQSTSEAVHQESVTSAGSTPSGGVQQSMSTAHQEFGTSIGSMPSGGVQQGVSAAHQESVTGIGGVPSGGVQQGVSAAHQESVTGIGGVPSGGVQQGVSAARQEPVANVESAPIDDLRPSMSVAHQGSAPSAARQESAISAGSTSGGIVQQSVSSTGQEVVNPFYQETVASIQVENSPTSISKTPMPVNQKRTETRTIGQYVVDSVKSSLNRSKSIQRTRRVYQLARNTGENWRSMVEKNRKKEE